MRILALESSCDETACAVVEDGHVRSSVIASQVDLHAPYGGIVPELASRQHMVDIVPVFESALAQAGIASRDIDAVAVTDRPGLIGALLVGVQFARGLALAIHHPLVGIHHLEGHLCSAFLDDPCTAQADLPPHVALIASGGHTELVWVEALGRMRVLGHTRDDAAGEAFDKVAKLLGLRYPGGPIIDTLAAHGNPETVAFPRAMMQAGNLEFSFSGLKTAAAVYLEKYGAPASEAALADICASFQAAVVDVLVQKTIRAALRCQATMVTVVGGVAANRSLRAQMGHACAAANLTLRLAPLAYCGDNAAMIGAAAFRRILAGTATPPHVSPSEALDAGCHPTVPD